MIGFLYEYVIPGFVRQLMLYSKVYQVPFCAVPFNSFDKLVSGEQAEVMVLDGTEIKSTVSYMPEMMDFPFKVDSKRGREFFGSAYVDSILAATKVLQQESLCKENLMKAMIGSPLSLYAIPTYYVKTFDDIAQRMKYIPKGFLKPSSGKQGIGAGKLSHDGDKLYILDSKGTHLFSEEFCKDYFERVRSKGFGFGLLQPCFDFSLDESHAVDFRLLRHRGMNGEWEETATYARIGETGLVSNVSQGGFIGDAKTIVQRIAGVKADALYDEILMLGREVPALIQRSMGDNVFCIGMDVAIDRDSLRPFALEANTYPGTKYHYCQLAESRVRYYKYLLNNQENSEI